MKNIEYSTKQMIAYFLIINEKVKIYKNKLLSNYIKELKIELENTNENHILSKVEVKLFANFPIKHFVNTNEIFYYAIVVFNRLLNYYNRDFNNQDIIKETEFVMTMFSARTITSEVNKIIEKIKNK